MFSYDAKLDAPYQDNLSTLIHDHTFRSLIDSRLFPMLKYIQKLGNKAIHTNIAVTRVQAVMGLKNLFEFTCWIDYCYSDEYSDVVFDESLLQDASEQEKTRDELKDLHEKLSSQDKKLEEVIKENATLREELTAKREENQKQRTFTTEDYSEFDTRKIYIDLELQLAGWNIGADCVEEQKVYGMPNKEKIGYADYVLFGDDGKPLAVIEAKKTSKDPRIGKQQAKLYADCLEKQYNKRPVIFYTNGFDYYLWDDDAYPERKVSGFYTKEELEWLHFKNRNRKPLHSPYIKDEITNRAYQKMAIQNVCDVLDKGHRKALLVMATGSGKTRTAISLVDVLINKGWVKNALFLADRTALVRQAKKNFKMHLPDLSLCNLLDSKDNPESRMIFSTYPTMMNAIDEAKSKDRTKLFTRGHFDLIIIDESHRSIYKKYQAIFEYFDGILLGLTATPKSDIDKNTYAIFDLESNVPTFAYELGEAIQDGYLVPYHTIETKLKFLEDGIHYDDLSEEEKEQFEDTFDDGVKDISSEKLNKFLFNKNTVDIVLQELMTKGIKIEGGDKLGKTIIFAKNKKHAIFIIQRFDALYPHLKGSFTKAIYNDVNYVSKLIDDFSTKERLPQIAVSVDMLDTGIDIPEIVNLVFFKKIRSKVKFWQMIGRGTRLCPDLFGVKLDKENFRIFDYCSNFEFFREEKETKETKLTKSLTENLFNIKTNIIQALQHFRIQTDEYIKHRENLVKEQLNAIHQIDETKFNSRMKIQYIHKYKEEKIWQAITDNHIRELEMNVAPLITSMDDDELAKRFDFLMYAIEFAELKGFLASKPKLKVIHTADKLSEKGSIPMIKRQEEIIMKVQTEEFWQDADIFEYEIVRIALRDLIKFLEEEIKPIYYTDFTDEVIQSETNEGDFQANDFQSYRKKVNQYLKEHQNDLVVYKLRNNKPLSEVDVKHLEKILWNELGTKDDYTKEFGDEPLLKLVSSLVGLDPLAANDAFSEFLSDESLNSNQMEFVKLIVTYMINNGTIDKRVLNEQPFNRYGSVVQLFDKKINVVKSIIQRIDEINARLDVG